MRLIRLVDCIETPWANGSGITRELLRDSAAPAPWNWRLSVATVSEPDPFSSLPGIGRILVAIGDVPLSLSIDGRAQHAQPGQLIFFAGESDVASVGYVATRDVNVMVRRRTTVAGAQVLEAGDPVVRAPDSELTAYVALTEGTVVGDQVLAVGDTVVIDDRDRLPDSLAGGRCLRVMIRPC